VSREHAYRSPSPLEALDYDLFDVHLGPSTSGPSSQTREAMRIGSSSDRLAENAAKDVAQL